MFQRGFSICFKEDFPDLVVFKRIFQILSVPTYIVQFEQGRANNQQNFYINIRPRYWASVWMALLSYVFAYILLALYHKYCLY